ncbi:hypothetical protein [Streptomyces sp. NPDC051776]|uniref:hypothetical protein n=1 Tax=Streptomyces sp. NPDC051776 TaxID=3155414 RepID=UPI003442CB17
MRIRFAGAAAVATAGILLLTACGSDDGGGGSKAGDENAGAGKKDEQRSTSPSPAKKAAPKFNLPPDVKVVIDDDKTGDKAKDEVLKDHGYALMAMEESFAKAKATNNFNRYWAEEAHAEYAANFKLYERDGATITGTDRFYGREVKSVEGGKALVTFCEDQRRTFDKIVKTGKVEKTKPSLKSFFELRAQLKKSGTGAWTVIDEQRLEGSKSCQNDA